MQKLLNSKPIAVAQPTAQQANYMPSRDLNSPQRLVKPLLMSAGSSHGTNETLMKPPISAGEPHRSLIKGRGVYYTNQSKQPGTMSQQESDTRSYQASEGGQTQNNLPAT